MLRSAGTELVFPDEKFTPFSMNKRKEGENGTIRGTPGMAPKVVAAILKREAGGEGVLCRL